MMLNVVYCESYDDEAQCPSGRCRDLGRVEPWNARHAVQHNTYLAVRMGWGPGQVILTDDTGRRVRLEGPTLWEMSAAG